MYKSCHKKYHYSAIQRLKPKSFDSNPDYFTFGTAGHVALAHYYGNDYDSIGALKLFEENCKTLPWTTVEEGQAILTNYFATAKPIEGEIVMLEETKEILYGDITLKFTMDMVVKNGNSYTVYDHKFYAGFPSDVDVTQNDQASIYLWAMRRMGMWPARFVLNVIKKDAPRQPTVLKNGQLSQAKAQLTTYELYLEALEKYNLPIAEYKEFLDWLQYRDNPFHHRYTVTRTSRELDLMEQEIWEEIKAMTNPNDRAFFRNPGRNCANCPFFDLCRVESEGGDVNRMREEYYREKENDER
jgi:hypothetical protein